MTPASWFIGLSLVGAMPPPESVADAVTLRDGSVVLGAMVEPESRGPVVMIVRRAWAEAKLPGRAKAWGAEADRHVDQALSERRERLLVWKRYRKIPPTPPDPGIDPVADWIEAGLAKTAGPRVAGEWPLMMIHLDRAEVASSIRKPEASNRLLRYGWMSRLSEVETMEPKFLVEALEDRGFLTDTDRNVELESLVEPHPVPETRWFERRAATELSLYSHRRLLRYRNFLADSIFQTENVAPSMNDAMRAVMFREMRGLPMVDTIPSRLKYLAGTGQCGTEELRLELTHDLSAVRVESSIWARGADDQWSEIVHRADVVRVADIPAELPGQADPPSKGDLDLEVFEVIAFRTLPAESQRHRPRLKSAARKALNLAHVALGREIANPGPFRPVALTLQSRKGHSKVGIEASSRALISVSTDCGGAGSPSLGPYVASARRHCNAIGRVRSGKKYRKTAAPPRRSPTPSDARSHGRLSSPAAARRS